MALYELRTYTLRVGAMAEAVKLYQQIGFPALQKGSHDKKLVGYYRPIPARSTSFCICGSSTMMLIVGLIGRCLCEQGLRRGLRVKVPPAADHSGSEAAPGWSVGATSLIGGWRRLSDKRVLIESDLLRRLIHGCFHFADAPITH
jgi:hypothetical protein